MSPSQFGNSFVNQRENMHWRVNLTLLNRLAYFNQKDNPRGTRMTLQVYALSTFHIKIKINTSYSKNSTYPKLHTGINENRNQADKYGYHCLISFNTIMLSKHLEQSRPTRFRMIPEHIHHIIQHDAVPSITFKKWQMLTICKRHE